MGGSVRHPEMLYWVMCYIISLGQYGSLETWKGEFMRAVDGRKTVGKAERGAGDDAKERNLGISQNRNPETEIPGGVECHIWFKKKYQTHVQSLSTCSPQFSYTLKDSMPSSTQLPDDEFECEVTITVILCKKRPLLDADVSWIEKGVIAYEQELSNRAAGAFTFQAQVIAITGPSSPKGHHFGDILLGRTLSQE
ncbi:hypothetical protein ARMGADRAFT_1037214 [Armillaria gallica]|uniref:Uncharacterized protein n=1 Tax=Armillaria gallica TaxID=47427 RepID=A0A2H3CMH2_ARMGA|nr:hypothetical protein ARMGADRAFT_1037214 [Armillaria gallica]